VGAFCVNSATNFSDDYQSSLGLCPARLDGQRPDLPHGEGAFATVHTIPRLHLMVMFRVTGRLVRPPRGPGAALCWIDPLLRSYWLLLRRAFTIPLTANASEVPINNMYTIAPKRSDIAASPVKAISTAYVIVIEMKKAYDKKPIVPLKPIFAKVEFPFSFSSFGIFKN